MTSEVARLRAEKHFKPQERAGGKELVRTAEKRGYVAHDQINALLASEELSSEQIENVLTKLSEMGINVVETQEARLGKEAADEIEIKIVVEGRLWWR